MLLTTLPSTLLSQVENSVVLKIDYLPASRENLPSYSFFAFRNASMLIDFFGVSRQMGPFLGETLILSQVQTPQFVGFSPKKSKSYFFQASDTYLLSPRFSIASKSLSSVLKFDSIFVSICMVLTFIWELLQCLMTSAYFICYLKLIVSNHNSTSLTQ